MTNMVPSTALVEDRQCHAIQVTQNMIFMMCKSLFTGECCSVLNTPTMVRVVHDTLILALILEKRLETSGSCFRLTNMYYISANEGCLYSNLSGLAKNVLICNIS